ncbi:DEAD/DEAH box helicase [Methylobacterium iners]|uniref:Transcription-repair-coupling factor n=1 Tax=Methylobacterium iners TaxID=418707 RepID=A0ABQ4RQZ3_9HYPH|nr:DEAD/DEAH box helicase [Methylobacterium iners]GJD93191.1 Transcription-repair-coupling factor [Methylobacterium iners]
MPASTKRKPAPNTAGNASLPLAPLGALAAGLLSLAGRTTPLVHVARDARRLERLAEILRIIAPGCSVAVYPEWDCLPYDRASPSRGTMGARAGVLRWLTDKANLPDFVLTTAPALIQRVPPPDTWAAAHLEIRVGDPLQPERAIETLQRLGYVFDDRVDEPGEVAVRGRVIDLFPAAAPRPCRIELDDARVTAIRSYDPVSQRSLTDAEVLIVDPATEIILAPDSEEALRPFSGQEHELPRFYQELTSLLDYVPEALLVVEAGSEARTEAFFEQIQDGQEGAVRLSSGTAPGVTKGLYFTPKEWLDLLACKQLAFAEEIEDNTVPVFARERRPTAAFARYLRERQKAGDRILLASSKDSFRRLAQEAVSVLGHKLQRANTWAAVLKAEPGQVLAMEAPLEAGFRMPELSVTALTAPDLFGHQASATSSEATAALPLGEVELRVGDVAIHEDHGLCVFEGLERVTGPHGQAEDAVRLRFADDAVLMVPASQAGRIWRYGSEVDAVSLDRLESGTWEKRRTGVEDAVRRTAQTMLTLAEARRQAKASVLVPPTREMQRFAAGFGFALTADQSSAIDAVLSDLASGHPMDRLACGDVGFGKTEVALRAAAAALFAGKQVAIAAPTTVLVRQHVQTFRRRFARFGIEVAQLSRLVPPVEAKRVKAGIADGSIRLVIGTHALAARGVRFADLGLVVVDEEQRFGAKQKERLRRLGQRAHVLTLTATPIPRTLQSALVGLQDLSVLATPPIVRQPIRTLIAPFASDTVRAALMRERRRGGQSFVVCPRIADVAPMQERLRDIAPELQVLVAHGELDPAEMDDVMVRFADGEGDVLLATNIIESGLDVPRANTMLVWQPDKFGLSQLHQLRGRVGRGQRRAVTYLLSDSEAPLSLASQKRLRTLEALDRLGAGFAISARDLDLRGAGDLVGEDQAGHVRLIGLGLYQHLLEQALRAARGEPVEDWHPDVQLGLSGHVPESYVPEPELRLSLYTRVARLRMQEEAAALREEIEDRFGPLPEPVEELITLAQLRVACVGLGIERLSGGPQGLAADFRPGRLEELIVKDNELERRGDRLILPLSSHDPAQRACIAAEFLEELQNAREGYQRSALGQI